MQRYKDGSNASFCERADTLGARADQVVFEEHVVEEECPMLAETMVAVSQTTLRDAIAGILGFVEEAVTALVSPEGHSGVKRAYNGVQAMLQRPVNKMHDRRLNSVELEGFCSRKSKKRHRHAGK